MSAIHPRSRTLTLVAALWAMGAVSACDPEGPSPADDGADTDDRPAVDPHDPESLYARHRRNKDELSHAIADLLHVDAHVIDTLPLENEADGFRTIAAQLEIGQLFVDRVAAGALQVAQDVLADARRSQPVPKVHHEVEYAGWTDGYRIPSQFLPPMGSPSWVWTTGQPKTLPITAPADGTYTLAIVGSRLGVEPLTEARVEVAVDGAPVAELVLATGPTDPALLQVDVPLTAGGHDLTFTTVAGLGDDPEAPVLDPFQPAQGAVALDHVDLIGPLEAGVSGVSPRDRLLICDPTEGEPLDCLERILVPLATRAWGRPLSEAEAADVVAMAEEVLAAGYDTDLALEYGLRRILMSPHFVFKLEVHPGDDVSRAPNHPLAAYELAGRLAHFVWGSLPDEALYDCAASGELLVDDGGPCSAEAQLARMLDDPRSEALVKGWAYQWLNLREVEDVFKVWDRFPTFTLALSEDMIEETEHVMDHMIHHDEPLPGVVRMDWTYLNNRLAEYYGLEPVGSDTLIPVTVDSTQRTGLPTHGSVLTGTSLEHRTAPIKRAVWLLDTFLCENLGPPPPSIPELELEDDDVLGALEAHNAPVCASCHDVLDPLGFALENFDGAGKWRETTFDGDPIDVDAAMPDGTPIAHPSDLTAYLDSDPRVGPCVTAKLAAYATGEAYLHDSRPEVVVALAAEAEAAGYSFHAIAEALIRHPLFTHRTDEGSDDE